MKSVLLCLTIGSLMSTAAMAGEISTNAAGHAFNPSFSPDGRWLAFEINDYEGVNDLYLVGLSGTQTRAMPQKVVLPGARSSFSDAGSVAGAAVWHPDGPLIFEGSNSGGTTRLFLLSPGTQGAGELIGASLIKGDLSWPAVSPDGKQVMFVSDATGGGDVYAWDRTRNAVDLLVSSPFSEMAPRYSADGSKFAYTRRNRGGEDLFVFEGASPRPWVGGNGDQTRPAWAGNTIVFFSNERGDDQWDIAASDSVGQKRTLAKDVRLPLRATPKVSPDGQWVLYGVSNPENADKLFLTRVDGSRTIAVSTGLVATGEPAMVEAGGRKLLAFTALPKEGADWRQLHVLDITSLAP